MWKNYKQSDLFVLSASGSVKRDGCLVMGKGLLLDAKRAFKGLDKVLGDAVKSAGEWNEPRRAFLYGFLPGKKLALLQTRWNWFDQPSEMITAISIVGLEWWCRENADKKVFVQLDGNFPIREIPNVTWILTN